MAKDIKVNLNSNTDKIERANNNVMRIQTQLGLADRLINIISRNEKRNTLILYWVIFMIVLGIAIIVFLKFR